MFKTRSVLTALLGYALLGVAAHAADGPAPADPDAGFLEFLGGVDGLADVNPNYLAQGNAARRPPALLQPRRQSRRRPRRHRPAHRE